MEGCDRMENTKVIKVGLLGLGTVGSGVYKLIERQKEEMCQKTGADIKIEKILVHNINKKRDVQVASRFYLFNNC